MGKKIKYLGNYYGANQGQTGSVYGGQGIKPTICSIDYKKGKGLVLRKWKERTQGRVQ